MIEQLPALIILTPLFGALTSPIVSHFNRKAGRWVITFCLFSAFIMSVIQMMEIGNSGEIHYQFGNWAPPMGIEFAIDSLNGILIILICFMAFLSSIYSAPFNRTLNRLKDCGYYSLIALLSVGLVGMCSTGDIFNLYVFLEVTSLSGYCLIAMGGDKGVLSAFRYLLIGTIGASFYLLGIAFIYGETGTLNMADMSRAVDPVLSTGTTLVAVVFFVVGFGIKMALFPLHGWQPAAYKNAHPGAAPLITAVMGKIPAYAMLRFFYFVFSANRSHVGDFMLILGIMGAIGMIYGSLKAIQQKDLRSILAYSSISQVGYIAIGISMGDLYGLIGAVYHIVVHAFMKGGLFFCIGAMKYKYGITRVNELGQIHKKMPKTSGVVVICALSMIGVPPLGGFFAKWDLAMGAADVNQYVYIGVLIASSLLSAVYFIRIIENIFMGEDRNLTENHPDKKGELPVVMLIPILICGLTVVMLGLCNTWFIGLLSKVIMGVT